MVKKTYSVTLDDKIVKEALKKIRDSGGKLSPLINRFLENFIKEKEGRNGTNN